MSIEKDSALLQLLFVAFVVFMMFLPSIIMQIQKLLYYSFGKIFFLYFTIKKKALTDYEKRVLHNEVPFYKKLEASSKRNFEHRVATFIETYNFHKRGNISITRDMKLQVAASATKLTFGFRKFTFPILKSILIYPTKYPSRNTQKLHKGEFNPRLKTLVFSWEDFLEGNEKTDDNINLGIHEFTHVIHINSYRQGDLNSIIFKKEFKALKKMIQKDSSIKKKLTTSDYFRKYAFENHYEFIAVMIENFIETPEEFKSEFPEIYIRIKRMLNFNFLGY